jgi:putative intracellular protease/amidase
MDTRRHVARVLVYTSSSDRIPHRKGGTTGTGTWLPEVTYPLAPLEKAGFDFAFATPDGKPCIIDPGATALMHWGFSRARRDAALEFLERLKKRGLAAPMKIADVVTNQPLLESFDALFIPGGHGPMTDLLHRNWNVSNELNQETGRLLQHFHDRGKPTAVICHAPAVLAAAPYIDGKWIYDSYNMTCVSMLADRIADLYTGGRPPDYPTRILRRHGGKVHNAMLGRSFVVEDRELISAQDPFAGAELGEKLLDKVRRYVASGGITRTSTTR